LKKRECSQIVVGHIFVFTFTRWNDWESYMYTKWRRGTSIYTWTNRI